MAYDFLKGYDPDIDYKAAMQTETDPNRLKVYKIQRALKTKDLTGQQALNLGVDVQEVINDATNAGVAKNVIDALNNVRAAKYKLASPEQLALWGNPTLGDTTSTPTPDTSNIKASIDNTPKTTVTSATTTTNPYNAYTKPVTDNTNLYNSMYDQQAVAQAAKIKAARDQAISGYNQQISQAPQQYQPYKDEASFAGAKQANAIKEAMAAAGQGVSGANLSAQSVNNAATTGTIGKYNLQQQDLVNSLKKAIADAQNSATQQELESNATTAAAKIQAAINENNRVSDTNYNRYRDIVGDTGYTTDLNGNKVQTVAGQQASAAIANTNANTEYQKLVNTGYPAEQAARMAQAQASLTGTNLQNDYQSLINAGYPAQQAADLAQKAATLTSTNLANQNQSVTNQYQAQILQGQIDSQTLNNAYQKMVNAGYPEKQAADLAAVIANTQGQQLSNAAQEITNQYLPQIQQGQIDAQMLQNAYQRLVNDGYPAQQAASIAATYANISQGNAQIAVAQQNANTNASEAAWAQSDKNPANKSTLQYKDYVSMGRDLLDKGSYDSYGQNYVHMYTPDQVLDWVKGLPLSAADKAQLANDLGL